MAHDRTGIIPKVCELLAQGRTLTAICAEKGFPDRNTIQRWSNEDPETAAAIAHARDMGFDARAEEAVEKAQNASDAALGRLAFDADRWYLAKLNPKRYGERTQVAQTDAEGNDVAPVDTIEALTAILAAAEARRDKDGSDLA